jgi:hypothetical protein
MIILALQPNMEADSTGCIKYDDVSASVIDLELHSREKFMK